MRIFGKKFNRAGTSPGTLVPHAGPAEPASFRVLRYSSDDLQEEELTSVADVLPFFDLPGLVWVDVAGLRDVPALEQLGERLGLHPLALEDVLHDGQRPKVQDYEGHAFVLLRQLRLRAGHLESEQVSLFFGEGFVLTIQATHRDDWEPVRQRLRSGRTRIRSSGADYLAYALVDAIVDSFFPLLEEYGDRIEEIQKELLDRPYRGVLEEVHDITRELILVRRAAWPHREVASSLERSESGLVDEGTRVFLRDCYDHTVQILDILESYRDLARGLMDLYLSTVSNRMNEVMKVLTIMASIFIPLTFLAGVYGMNFDPDASPFNMPELRWRWGYPAFWVVIVAMAAGMVAFFKRRNWW